MPSESSSSSAAGEREWTIDAALKRLDADIRQRLLIFDGGPQLMSWEAAHRLHADEPYIGCPFCHDQFVEKARLEAAEAELERLRGELEPELVEAAMFAVFGEDSAVDPTTGEPLEGDWARMDREAVDSRLRTYLRRELTRAALSPVAGDGEEDPMDGFDPLGGPNPEPVTGEHE